jgi:hypothetical protein
MAYADYQVAEPRQMCSSPHIANTVRATLEFAGGVLAAQRIHPPSPSYKTCACQTRARWGWRAIRSVRSVDAKHDH